MRRAYKGSEGDRVHNLHLGQLEGKEWLDAFPIVERKGRAENQGKDGRSLSREA